MKFVIIGNGVAGITAAKTIRDKDPEAEIQVYTNEPHTYYSRIQLIEFLGNQIPLEKVFFYPKDWYKKNRIEVNLESKVGRIHPLSKEIELIRGEKISYHHLLLANGSHSFVPPIRGAEKPGVFTLRTLTDTFAIKNYVKTEEVKAAIVIGGGLLGLESARGLDSLGLKVTVVEFFDRLLPRQLDEEGASILKSQIEAMGIGVLVGGATEEILGEEKTSGILLKDGSKLGGELVLISAGIRSNVSLAKKASLKVNKGVVVDKYLQTNNKDIYAAGDVAEFDEVVHGIIPAALEQSKIAALNMVEGNSLEYKGTVPSNTLKVMGIDLTSIGIVNPSPGEKLEELRVVDEAKGMYKKFVLKNDRIVGAIILGEKRNVTAVSKMVRKEVNISNFKGKLAQEDFDLKEIIRAEG